MRYLVVLVGLSCFLLGCTNTREQTVGVDPCAVFRLTDAQRARAEQRARGGDAGAAKQLADEAIYVRHDYRAGIAWLRLAASYGDQDAKHSLEVYLEGLRDAKKPKT